jgi:hypothetical protein
MKLVYPILYPPVLLLDCALYKTYTVYLDSFIKFVPIMNRTWISHYMPAVPATMTFNEYFMAFGVRGYAPQEGSTTEYYKPSLIVSGIK